MEGGGGGEKRERLPASPTILENALLISRFGWFVNWQLVKIEVWLTGYPWITRIVKSLCSLIKHVPGDWKNCIPFFFCSRPNFLDELARKRLLCNLVPRAFPSKNGWGRPRGRGWLAMQASSLREEFLLGSWTAGSWEFFWILRDWWQSEHATAAVKPYSSTLQFLVVCVTEKLLLIVELALL